MTQPISQQTIAFASWSGGKDSCLAVWRAKQAGIDVKALLTMFDAHGEKSRSHGLTPEVIRAQAAAMQMEHLQGRASWADYESQFIGHLQTLRKRGFTAGVFGDIDLQPHRDWEVKVCARADINVHLPLWQESRRELVDEFWRLGFKALVVCTDSRFLPARYCGLEFDRAYVDSLPAGVDACGENGEFHTVVYDGPLFRESLNLNVLGLEEYVSPPEFGSAAYTFAKVGLANA
jgi:uncharacterized protein (TIGR00290 family)